MYFIKPTDPNPVTTGKAVMLFMLCAIWVGTGLLGHDPWKPDEAYSFGIIYWLVQHGDWLVPTLAGEPFMDKPPLFYWTAALLAKAFAWVLPLHDGARLASGVYSGLSLLFIGLAGRKLYGENRGWAAAIITIGCLGMLVHAHQMMTDLALLAGIAMMLYGFSHSQEKSWRAGLFIGLGIATGFMAKGFIAPILFVLIATALPIFFVVWRSHTYRRSVALASVLALPLMAIWPALLYQKSPKLFNDWAWAHNLGRWFDYAQHLPGSESFYYLQNLPWMAWPAWPLAVWVVWKSRQRLAMRDDLQLPLVSFVVMLLTLSFVPNIQEAFVLPILLPIALLATASLSMLKRGAANALDWFGLMVFALLAIALWWGWLGLLDDNGAKITQVLRAYQPSFTPVLNLTAFGVALFATLLWIVLVWRVGRSMRRAVVNWAAGMTLIWTLAMTLWLPWLDSGKSYRNMATALEQALPEHYSCIRRENLGDGQRAMLHYFGNVITEVDAKKRCDLRLVQGHKLSKPLLNETRWQKIWEGSRMDDKSEQYRLYQKVVSGQ
ncbi:MAG: glycosyltransferase family 39 protein [Gallionella sp.]